MNRQRCIGTPCTLLATPLDPQHNLQNCSNRCVSMRFEWCARLANLFISVGVVRMLRHQVGTLTLLPLNCVKKKTIRENYAMIFIG